jgi:hypothetical protein
MTGNIRPRLRREIKKAIDQLPGNRLTSLADFVAFLGRPILAQQIEAAERDLKANKGVDWRKCAAMLKFLLRRSAASHFARTVR